MKRLGKYRIWLIIVIISVIVWVVVNPSIAKEDSVRESMIRYLFNHNECSTPEYISAYYIQIEGPKGVRRDPSNHLINHFRGYVPKVKKVSECTSLGIRAVYKPINGKRDMVIQIQHMTWRTPWSAVVTAACHQGLCMSGGTFLVVRTLFGWNVVKTYQMFES